MCNFKFIKENNCLLKYGLGLLMKVWYGLINEIILIRNYLRFF